MLASEKKKRENSSLQVDNRNYCNYYSYIKGGDYRQN